MASIQTCFVGIRICCEVTRASLWVLPRELDPSCRILVTGRVAEKGDGLWNHRTDPGRILGDPA